MGKKRALVVRGKLYNVHYMYNVQVHPLISILRLSEPQFNTHFHCCNFFTFQFLKDNNQTFWRKSDGSKPKPNSGPSFLEISGLLFWEGGHCSTHACLFEKDLSLGFIKARPGRARAYVLLKKSSMSWTMAPFSKIQARALQERRSWVGLRLGPITFLSKCLIAIFQKLNIITTSL